MAQYDEWSFPWPSGGIGDGTDTALTDELFAFFLRALYNNGDGNAAIFPRSNEPFNSIESPLLVRQQVAPSMVVEVTPGMASVVGRFMYRSTIRQFTIANNVSGNPRIDSIVLRADYTAQTVRLALLAGTPDPAPSAPTLTQIQEDIWEVAIANIDVANGALNITDADITDVREFVFVPGIQQVGTMVAGNLLVATNAEDLEKLTPPPDLSWLIGDTGLDKRMEFVSLRPHIIRGQANVGLGTSGTGTILSMNTMINPDGFITSLASNAWTLEEGKYEARIFGTSHNVGAVASQAVFFILNVTANLVVAQTTSGFVGPGASVNLSSPTFIIESNGTDSFQLRGVTTDPSTIASGGSSLVTSPGNLSGYGRYVEFRKLQN